MSAVEQAWQEFKADPRRYFLSTHDERLFKHAYRRALKDAADATHANGDSWAITENVPPNVRDVVSNVLWGTTDWLRVEARAVAPTHERRRTDR